MTLDEHRSLRIVERSAERAFDETAAERFQLLVSISRVALRTSNSSKCEANSAHHVRPTAALRPLIQTLASVSVRAVQTSA